MKNRLPRKLKKRFKKAMSFSEQNKIVMKKALMDVLVYGVAGTYFNHRTGEHKNIPISEALKLRHNG